MTFLLLAAAIFVTGDSTANNVDHRGWGDPFAAYFDPAKAAVLNRARAGRSSRTFLTEGLWDRVASGLKPGDFVLIQFGHNDGGPLDTGRARGSLPGAGEETREVTMPDGKRETVHTYGWYLRKFIADTKAAGATPVLLSLTVRNIWKDGRVERGSGRFNQWASEVACAEKVAFADVTTVIADGYESLGAAKVKAFFPSDYAHTSPEGADFNAAAVVAALKSLPGRPLDPLLSTKGRAVRQAPDPNLPTLFLIGDSTVRNGRGNGANGQWGWGEPLADLFDSAKINVVNRALGGTSSRTYFSGLWTSVLARLKPGDFLVMQFGHNDGGPLDDKQRARGTLGGVGEETREIENPVNGKHETVHTYGWYLGQFIAGARARGATPIVCSPVPRKIWKDGHIVRSSSGYAGWAAQVADSEKAPFIDLNQIVAAQYDALGPETVELLFADEHTHTTRAGAERNAAVVAAALREILDGKTRK